MSYSLCSIPPYDWSNDGSVDAIWGGEQVSVVILPWVLMLFWETGVEFKGKIMSKYSRDME